MPIKIRTAKHADAGAIHAVHVRAIREGTVSHYSPVEVEIWAGRMAPEWYIKPIAANIFLVAELDSGVVAGFGELDIEEAEVKAVYVTPEHKRGGIGRRLLMCLEAIARERGLRRLTLNASLNAEPFYVACGFIPVARTTHELGATGVHIQCITMAKELDALPHRPAAEFIEKTVTVTMDRPLGSKHPRWGFVYPVNYGYIAGVDAPDGHDLDAYVLAVAEPRESFTGTCIAVVHRLDDDDDKLIVVPEGLALADDDIRAAIEFQEQFFISMILRNRDE